MWRIFLPPPASRHCLQVKNTPAAAAAATKHNISISVDGIRLCPRDPSGAGCHVSDCTVWEPDQPKGFALPREKCVRREGREVPSSLLWPAMTTVAEEYPPGPAEAKQVLLTEWALWCSKHKGPNPVSHPVHCGSAFCAHLRKGKKKKSLSNAQRCRVFGKTCVYFIGCWEHKAYLHFSEML